MLNSINLKMIPIIKELIRWIINFFSLLKIDRIIFIDGIKNIKFIPIKRNTRYIILINKKSITAVAIRSNKIKLRALKKIISIIGLIEGENRFNTIVCKIGITISRRERDKEIRIIKNKLLSIKVNIVTIGNNSELIGERIDIEFLFIRTTIQLMK